MIKLTLQQIKETRNYVYYESPNFETLFRSDMFAMKLWIPKSELRVIEAAEGMPFPVDGYAPFDIEGKPKEAITYPPYIEVGILDDSDKPTLTPRPTMEDYLREIFEGAKKET